MTRRLRLVVTGAIVGVMAMIASTSPAAAFTDVSTNHPFYTEITWASNNGIVNGYPDDTFRGGGQVTRQAVAAFLFRLAGNPSYVPPASAHYPDVPTDYPFYLEIEWLRAVGVGQGYGDGTFKPGSPVTRQAMAAYLCRLIECREGAPPANQIPQYFFDVSRSNPFFIDITFMYITEIANGYPYGFGQIFKPSGIVTRQAATAFIYRLDQLVQSAGTGAERSVPGNPGWGFTAPEWGTVG